MDYSTEDGFADGFVDAFSGTALISPGTAIPRAIRISAIY
jgi:hypothetical protein